MKPITRVVSTSFWQDEKVVEIFSPEDKLFYLYLITNPHTTQLGVYKLVPKTAAFELGYSKEAVVVLLERFESKYGMIKFSKETNEVAIKNYLKHSIVKGGKPVLDCLMKEERQVEDKSLLMYIYSNISTLSNKDTLNNTVKEYIEHLYQYINDNDNENERIVACDSLRLRDWIISESIKMQDTGERECEWCGNKVDALHSHHFPIPKRMGGTKTVNICQACHEKFHLFEFQNGMGVYATPKKKQDDKQAKADAMFETLWKLYPRKLGKGSVRPATKRNLYDVGFEQLKRCIERYKEFIKGKDEQYVMYGSTFFNSGYVDYLDENYGIDTGGKEQTKDDFYGWQ